MTFRRSFFSRCHSVGENGGSRQVTVSGRWIFSLSDQEASPGEPWTLLPILIPRFLFFHFLPWLWNFSGGAPSLSLATWLRWVVILHYVSVVWDCQAVKVSDKNVHIISISNGSGAFLDAVCSDPGGNDDSDSPPLAGERAVLMKQNECLLVLVPPTPLIMMSL